MPQHTHHGMLRHLSYLTKRKLYMNHIRTLLLGAALWLGAMGAAAQQTDAFPYPNVPDSLRTPDTRATYVMRHYWDRFDFADTTLMHRPEITEQGFANFADLLPRINPATAAMGIASFADRLYSGGNGEAANAMRDYFADLIEKYLGDSESPLHNDLLYAQFLDVMSANKFASVAERTRNEYMARNLRKNLPGSTAADFEYIDRQGAKHRMHDFKAPYTILYFYDPDCDHCHEVASEMARIPAIANGNNFRVLAVYAYDDEERWRKAQNGFPASWTDGLNPDGKITAEDIYYIKSVPSVYLLDSNKKVLLKNPTTELLREAVEKADGHQ